MKTKLFFTVFSLLLGLGFAKVWRSGAPARLGPVAFTAHSTQVGYGRDGSAFLTIVKNFALRGDGSYYESQTNIDHARNGALTTLVIKDKATARETVIHPIVKMMTSYSFDGESFVATGVGCTQEIVSAPKRGEFLGYRVVETARETTHDDGVERERNLYALDLNCLLVYSEAVWSDRDGNAVGKDVYEVNQIAVGEPNPVLFDVPIDYLEAPPSRAIRLEVETLGRGDDSFARDFLKFSGDKLAGSDARYLAKKYIEKP